ncbi:MAG TPA: lipocalin-like domain-containing protein [Candidatus Krumholzibacteria bacterium]|nr:lipocalin-like domain-containing protein [Candidatus Krumholzibacteria bacterium]HPD70692.1 lipocalin-like domain-containing protein [Candidatus Krumholzibacteria bacterium]HRY39608.1 lipocalin-like domain-containing protein [Candidatus Krumholzibacteria bacterium]
MTWLAILAAFALTAWREAAPGHAWAFPRDHHAHPEFRHEWWYVTGQLSVDGASEPTHGFQFTLFRIGLLAERPPWDSSWTARDLVLGHAAVTDLRGGGHRFSEVLTRTGPGLGGFPAVGDSVLAWCRAPAGTAGRWEIRTTPEGFAIAAVDSAQGLAFALGLAPERPLVFHGPGGFSVKDPTSQAGSLYYSVTRLAATGTLDGRVVAGRAWLDREIFTSQLAARHVGWDWLSLQLADGRDVMVFSLRGRDGAGDVTRATVVEPSGAVSWLEPGAPVLTALERWRGYPVKWRLSLPEAGIELVLAALVEDQENVGPHTGLRYWEGAVAGPGCRGYAELTGYAGAEASGLRSLRKIADELSSPTGRSP